MKRSFLIALIPALALAQANLVRNPSFEEKDAQGNPKEWSYHCTGASTAGRSEIPSPDGKACGFINKVADAESHVAALDQKHLVEPNKEYLLTALCKGRGSLFGYEYTKDDKWIRCTPATSVASNDWAPYSVRFKTSPTAGIFHVRFEIFGKGTEAKGWIDNVYFGEPAPAPVPPSVTATASGHSAVLKWTATPGHTYLIYRSRYPDVTPDGNSHATAKGDGNLTFTDTQVPRDWNNAFYRIVTCDNFNQVSQPSPALAVHFPVLVSREPVAWTDSVLNKVRRYGAAPASNPQWNLNLALAGNEAESRQILVQAGSAPLRGLDVKISSLEDAKGNPAPDTLSVSAFETRYAMVSKICDSKFGTQAGLIPDPLPPWRGPIEVPAEANQSIWIQAVTKPGCPAGIYTGSVTLFQEGKAWKTIPLQVEVFGFELPATPSFMSAFAIWGKELAKGHGLTMNSPEYKRMYEKYYWFMVERRLPPDDIPVDIFSPEAARFLNDPRVNSFRIPCDWGKIDIPKLTKIADHIRANGWMKKGYIYCADEPTPEQYPKVRELSRDVHAAAADLPFLITEQPEKGLEGAIDIWCPLLSGVDWEKANARRALGERLWWYTCCSPKAPYPTYLIDDIGISHRVLSWLQAKHGIEGVLYWSVNICSRYRDKYEDFPSVWEDAGLFPNTNGDGFLLYPGKQIGIDGPVSSVRLEILRDGNEDVEYLVLLRNLLKDQNQFEAFIHPVITDFTHWTREPAALEQQKILVARKILELKK